MQLELKSNTIEVKRANARPNPTSSYASTSSVNDLAFGANQFHSSNHLSAYSTHSVRVERSNYLDTEGGHRQQGRRSKSRSRSRSRSRNRKRRDDDDRGREKKDFRDSFYG